MIRRLRVRAFDLKHLIYLQLFLVCAVLFVTTELGLPATLMNLTDGIISFLACVVIMRNFFSLGRIRLTIVDVAVLLFLIYALTTSVVNAVNPLQVVWAFRVTFRYYIFYYCCIALLGKKDIQTIMRMFEILFSVNIVMVLFEYFVQGKDGDYLGGIFGVEQGSAGYTNVFLTIMLIYEMQQYLCHRINLCSLVYYFVVSLTIASLAELKFLYIEAVLIVVCSVVLCRPNMRTYSLLLVSLGGLFVGLQMLRLVFPESYDLLISGEGTDDYLSASWTGGRELGRTTAFQFIDSHFFASQAIHNAFHVGSGDIVTNRLFGFGFGSAEPSALVQNPFAINYSETQYGAFEFADRYLELGFVGLGLYVAIYIAMFIHASQKSAVNNEGTMWNNVVKILIPIILFNVWYGSLRSEYSYLLFFILAVPRVWNIERPKIQER